MYSLFISLGPDEEVSVLVAKLLRGRRYDCTTAHNEGRLGLSDRDQLAHAVSLQRALLTHNRADFEALARSYLDNGLEHYGITLARRYAPCEVVRRLTRLLDQVTADEMRNQVRYL